MALTIAKRCTSIVHMTMADMAELADRRPNAIRLENADISLPPPRHVIQATQEAVGVDRYNSYLPLQGLIEMRQAIADRYDADLGIRYDLYRRMWRRQQGRQSDAADIGCDIQFASVEHRRRHRWNRRRLQRRAVCRIQHARHRSHGDGQRIQPVVAGRRCRSLRIARRRNDMNPEMYRVARFS